MDGTHDPQPVQPGGLDRQAAAGCWNTSWKYASDSIGLGGLFLDSSFNLSSDKFHFIQNTDAGRRGATADQLHLVGHYRGAQDTPKAILSQYRAHLELMRDMQGYGYVYCNEDLGVFGIHRHGPGIQARLDSLFMWSDCICTFDVPAIQNAGADPADVFFRGLAYPQMWSILWDIKGDTLSFNYYGLRGDFDRPQAWHLALLKAYCRTGASSWRAQNSSSRSLRASAVVALPSPAEALLRGSAVPGGVAPEKAAARRAALRGRGARRLTFRGGSVTVILTGTKVEKARPSPGVKW